MDQANAGGNLFELDQELNHEFKLREAQNSGPKPYLLVHYFQRFVQY